MPIVCILFADIFCFYSWDETCTMDGYCVLLRTQTNSQRTLYSVRITYLFHLIIQDSKMLYFEFFQLPYSIFLSSKKITST